MKKTSYLIILLLISTACTTKTPKTPSNVTSWGIIEPDILNKKIQLAYKANLEWAAKPELYVFNLFELSGLKKVSYEYNADSIEGPKNITIKIIRDGFLDDSVRGDIQHLKLNKDNKGIWQILTINRTIRCWRREKPIYSSEACP